MTIPLSVVDADLVHVESDFDAKFFDLHQLVEKVERKVDLILTEEAFKKLHVRVARIEAKLGIR